MCKMSKTLKIEELFRKNPAYKNVNASSTISVVSIEKPIDTNGSKVVEKNKSYM